MWPYGHAGDCYINVGDVINTAQAVSAIVCVQKSRRLLLVCMLANRRRLRRLSIKDHADEDGIFSG